MTHKTNKLDIQSLLARPISFNPAIARAVGGVKPGLFMCQLIYWSDKGKDSEWIYKTQAEWEEETCLSRAEQETARFKLVSNGFIQEKRSGDHGILHFRVHWETLLGALNAGKPQAPLLESSKGQCGKAAKANAGNQQSLNTENTTENTTADPAPPLPEFPFPEFIKEYQNQRLKAFRTLPRIPLKELDQARETLTDYGITDEQAVEYAKALGAKWRSEDVKFWPVSLLKFDGALLARLDKERVVEEMEDADLMSEMKRLFPGWVPKSERTS